MNLTETEKIINSLIETFVISGNISLDLRKKGLKKKIPPRELFPYYHSF